MAEANLDSTQPFIGNKQGIILPVSGETGRPPNLEIKSKVNAEYQRLVGTFPPDIVGEKIQSVTDAFNALSERLSNREGFEFGEVQQAILRLKLARYLERENNCDVNTLFDAIVESPNFISNPKGSLKRLFEVHEQKTLLKIAEMRKRRANMGNTDVFNPYESLFATRSGNYYLARLLNMPHLEKESEYMNHCIGTDDSYLNRIKHGEIEIFSLREVPELDPDTGKLEWDVPVVTIEYNLKTKTIEQIKGLQEDENGGEHYLQKDDYYFDDVVDALRQLRISTTDSGKLRNFKSIAASELRNIKVEDYHLLTDRGEVSFQEFDPDTESFVLKTGTMRITPEMPRKDVAKIVRIVTGVNYKPENIALNRAEVTPNTIMYIGKLFPGFSKTLPDHVTHIYTEFPGKRITRETMTIGTDSKKDLHEKINQNRISSFFDAEDMFEDPEFKTEKKEEEVTLISLNVDDLGLKAGSTTIGEVYKQAHRLGLDLCPAEVGPRYCLKMKDQLPEDTVMIGMKLIGWSKYFFRPGIFIIRNAGENKQYLDTYFPNPKYVLAPDTTFVFCTRKTRSPGFNLFKNFRN